MRNPNLKAPDEGLGTRLVPTIRGFLTTNLSLKIFALGLAMLMWGFVASQKRGESTEIKFTAPLVIKNIPTDLEVTSSVQQSVTVLLKVRRDVAKTVNPNQFQVVVDLRDQYVGEYDYKLTEKNISYNNVANPPGISVLQINPGTIPLTLEGTVVRQIPIKPRYSGDLARGFALKSITFDPPMAELRGPESVLNQTKFIVTQPLDVSNLKEDIEMTVSLDLPNLLRLNTPSDDFFKATLFVSANPGQLLLNDIPVVFDNQQFNYKASITKLNAHLEGPKELIDGLDSKKIFALVDLSKFPPGDYRGLTPKLNIPPEVKVLEQWPILDLFVLNRKLEAQVKPGADGKN